MTVHVGPAGSFHFDPAVDLQSITVSAQVGELHLHPALIVDVAADRCDFGSEPRAGPDFVQPEGQSRQSGCSVAVRVGTAGPGATIGNQNRVRGSIADMDCAMPARASIVVNGRNERA